VQSGPSGHERDNRLDLDVRTLVVRTAASFTYTSTDGESGAVDASQIHKSCLQVSIPALLLLVTARHELVHRRERKELQFLHLRNTMVREQLAIESCRSSDVALQSDSPRPLTRFCVLQEVHSRPYRTRGKTRLSLKKASEPIPLHKPEKVHRHASQSNPPELTPTWRSNQSYFPDSQQAACLKTT
jgi:hypothetical protein